ncbi:MAG: 1-(5-phosphoribosyl)-5-[(5-phosphoribosylamino)methylideneamino]imidazole-4-carboxamide isomerase [Bacteroidota bacterium]
MKIIPAVDIIKGQCVRLTQGDYDTKKVYYEDPLEVAKMFEDAGIQYLHLVDLDGAKAGQVTNWDVVKSIAGNTRLHVDFGGGIKTEKEISKLFDLGVRQVNLGSIAVKSPEVVYGWIEKFGPDKIILSADVKNNKVAISGWLEDSAILITDFIERYLQHGIRHITCTDISQDGMLSGPNIELYKNLSKLYPTIKFIASGGVSSLDDLKALKKVAVDGVIVGKAIYEGRIPLHELTTI